MLKRVTLIALLSTPFLLWAQCPTPTAPLDQERCGPGPFSLTASGTPNHIWFDSPVGGLALDTTATFVTPGLPVGSQTYYVGGFDSVVTSAIRFDGVDDYIALNDSLSGSNTLSTFTSEAWVRTSFTGGTSENWSIVDYDRSEFFNFFIEGDGTVGFGTTANGSGTHDMFGTSQVNDGVWHHVAVVYDGTDKIIYVDGVEDARAVNPHGGAALGTNLTRFGFIGDGSESPSFDSTRNNIHYEGDLAAIRLWHDVRTPTEINNFMLSPDVSAESDLWLYFKTEEGADTILVDEVAGRDGVMVNMDSTASWITDGPLRVYECSASRSAVTVTVNPTPTPDLGADQCVVDGTTMLDPGSGYVSYLWSTGAITPTITVGTTGEYWVEVSDATCTSRDTVFVSSVMSASGTSSDRCGDGTLTLTASGATDYAWYDAATGGNLMGVGSPFVTPSLSTTTTFYLAGIDTPGASDALRFDGTDDYVALPALLSGANTLPIVTAEGWVRTSFSSGGQSDNWSLIDFDRSEFFNLYVHGDGRVGFSTMAASDAIDDMYSTQTVNDGTWHHIAGVYDGTDKIIYIDGVEVARVTNAHSGLALGTTNTRFGIIGDGSEAGSFNAGRNNVYFDGDLASVRVWTTVRSEAQLAGSRYQQFATAPGLWLNYTTTDASGTTLTDAASGLDGTLYNMSDASWIGSGPIQVGVCQSGRVPVVATVYPLPPVDLGPDTCAIDSVTLDAGPGMVSYLWSDGSTDQTLSTVISGQYWVEVDDGGPCTNRDTIEVEVLWTPLVTPAGSCGPSSLDLMATSSPGSPLFWYDSLTGGTLVGSGSTLTTPVLSTTTTYYVEANTISTDTSALSLNGSNQYAAISDFFYQGTGYSELTVEAWVRTSSGGDQVIASFDRSDYWRLEINGDGAGTGQVGFDLLTNAGIIDFGSTTRVDDGTWHHVAAVYDNGFVGIYIDGVLDASTTQGTTFGSGNTRYGFIGVGSEATTYNGTTGPNNYFNGELDQVRIWSVARSQPQLSANQNVGCLEGTLGLEMEYRIEEASGATLGEASGSARAANLINGGTWTSAAFLAPSCEGCATSRIPVTATISGAVIIDSAVVQCPGLTETPVDLYIQGGTGLYDAQETGGAFPYSGSYASSSLRVRVPHGSIYEFAIQDADLCGDSISVNIPALGSSLVSGSSSGTCQLDGRNEWVYFTDASGEVIGAVHDQGQNLGEVRLMMTHFGTPQLVNTFAVLERQFLFETENPAGASTEVRLPFTGSELSALITEASGSPSAADDLTGIGEVALTKYEGPTADQTFDDSDASSVTVVNQSANGSQFGAEYINLTIGPITSQAEFWLHGLTTPLPVEWAQFDVESQGAEAHLNWVTATEQNNWKFIVEYSTNGTDFIDVAEIQGSGTSNQLTHYEYVHYQVEPGIAYYRLRQLDFDGASEHSEVRTCVIGRAVFSNLTVFPNPAQANSPLQVTWEGGEEVLVVVYDMTGVQHYTMLYVSELGEAFDIDHGLAPGVYIVTASSDERLLKHRLVVQ